MAVKALCTGANGQVASYLIEYLLEQGIEVHGIIRRNSVAANQESRIHHLENKIKTYYGDLQDAGSLEKIMLEVKPDLIFNIGAMSHVRVSFDVPQYTASVNAIGVLNMLEAYRKICPKARFIQASSSEMFGNSVDADGYQRESTPMHPTSPYGVSKLFGYAIVRNYRNAYNLFASNYICFNTESPRRGESFVTNKVVIAAVKIKLGLQKELVLGNMDSYRDWGHAKDYCKGIYKIITHDKPDDFLIATGETHSVRELCDFVFSYLDMDYEDYVRQDEKFMRPEELKYLRGDNTKFKTTFGWQPDYDFQSLLTEMVEFWMNHYKK